MMHNPYAHNDDDGKDHPEDVYLDVLDAEKRRLRNERRRERRRQRNARLQSPPSSPETPNQ